MDPHWDTEERLAVFIDYENLALGAREHLGGLQFDFGPIAAALAARGRVVVRRAYADWSYFDHDRRALTRHQVELIEMPQRMGASRKNAADIKMVVDAIEMAFERGYISTFVICTGDSDFSPLVHKLRELNRRVIGVGVEKSTSLLLPPACDEFLFYDRLEGVDVPEPGSPRRSGPAKPDRARRRKPATDVEPSAGNATTGTASLAPPATQKPSDPAAQPPEPLEAPEPSDVGEPSDAADVAAESVPMEVTVARTLADLTASPGAVTASTLKRTLLRKDPTFSEADYGFRTFGEFLRFLSDRDVVQLAPGPATGDPTVSLPEQRGLDAAFALLREVVAASATPTPLSGLKDQLQKRRPDFSEKSLGYRGFIQFCRAAETAGAIKLTWNEETENYDVTAA